MKNFKKFNKKGSKVKIIPLGGLDEIGKNMTAIEYKDEILIIDCGIAFPDADMPGIDVVIPDFSYVLDNKKKVKGIVLTHGHLDHIGALPYLFKNLGDVPVYGTKLTIGLVESRLKEHNLLNEVERKRVKPGAVIKLGRFKAEFIRTNHSIADAAALAIHTPEGVIVHSGDFKVDFNPIHGETIDLQRFAELGREGVLAFLCESTNVETKGYTMSESEVGKTFADIFAQSEGKRIMVATFSSNIDRVQQIVDFAKQHDRKIVIQGRSMVNVVETASRLGYLDVPKDIFVDAKHASKYKDEQLAIVMTGSQGEPMAALSRIARGTHRDIEVHKGDRIVFSSTPIPGNETAINTVINQLHKRGAEVILEDTHVSGHACQEEIKLLHTLVQPKYFVPVHGEYRHLKTHAELAENIGMDKEDIFIMEIGDVLELNEEGAKIAGSVEAGRTFVDGSGVGDIGNIVLKDRQHLSEDGLVLVIICLDSRKNKLTADPEVVSRGFVYIKESGKLIYDAKNLVNQTITNMDNNQLGDWNYIKKEVRNKLNKFFWKETRRNPMILPFIMDTK